MRARTLRNESGTSMVEFAVLAPVFVFMLVGIIEVGRYIFFAILAANAARAGVQYGAQNLTTVHDTAGIQNAALADAQNLSNLTASPAPYCSTGNGALLPCSIGVTPSSSVEYYVKVKVSGTFRSLLNYPGIPNNVPVSGTAIMRVVNQ
jgi:Flp pilus assembly protein TadG